MISQVLSIISVLSCLTYHYTAWKRMSSPTDQYLSTSGYIYIYIYTYIYILDACLNDLTSPVIISVLSCLTYHYTPWKRMSLPTDKCWSTGWNIRCTYWMFAWMISTDLSIISVLFDLSCPHTHWKRTNSPIYQLLSTVWYVIYILDACMNDLKSLVIHKCVILPHVSLYTLKMNDLTHWSTFFNCMLYYMYILCVCINDFACLVLIHV